MAFHDVNEREKLFENGLTGGKKKDSWWKLKIDTILSLSTRILKCEVQVKNDQFWITQ